MAFRPSLIAHNVYYVKYCQGRSAGLVSEISIAVIFQKFTLTFDFEKLFRGGATETLLITKHVHAKTPSVVSIDIAPVA